MNRFYLFFTIILFLRIGNFCSGPLSVFYDPFQSPDDLSRYVLLDNMEHRHGADPLRLEVRGGQLIGTPTGADFSRARVFLDGSAFNPSFSDHVVEADAMIENHEAYADFGIAFRESNGSYYAFLWNGNPENRPPSWQVAKFTGDPCHCSWPAAGRSNPAYLPETGSVSRRSAGRTTSNVSSTCWTGEAKGCFTTSTIPPSRRARSAFTPISSSRGTVFISGISKSPRAGLEGVSKGLARPLFSWHPFFACVKLAAFS